VLGQSHTLLQHKALQIFTQMEMKEHDHDEIYIFFFF
jgi:hypothetical protein